jgi:primosomal protein N' (replication factor Y)
VSLSYHHIGEGAAELLRCHYCNYTQLHPQHCPECTSPYFKNFGSGTQRVEQELTRLFPQLRAIRFDSDTTRNKGDHRRLLAQFANGEADILLGTQMLTKGLDLAGVTLVGVVSADGLLNLSDYRASERAFQTLTQVAGRAGRGDDPGRVIIQTYTPEHRVIQAVRRHEYAAFVGQELAERAALHYPPSGRLILLKLSGLNAAEVEVAAAELASVCREYIQQQFSAAECELLGPAPAAIMRVANRYRWQILLKLPLGESAVFPELGRLRDRTPRSVSLTIDVDPLNFG